MYIGFVRGLVIMLACWCCSVPMLSVEISPRGLKKYEINYQLNKYVSNTVGLNFETYTSILYMDPLGLAERKKTIDHTINHK